MHLGEKRLDGWMDGKHGVHNLGFGWTLVVIPFPFYNCLVSIYGACFHHVVFTILYHT